MIIYFNFNDFDWMWQEEQKQLIVEQLLKNWEQEAREYMQNNLEEQNKNWQEVYMRMYDIYYIYWKDDPNFDFVQAIEEWAYEQANKILKEALKNGQWEVNL